MKIIKYRHILALLAVLAFCINLPARQAKSGPMTFRQPDGTTFVATLRGDEFQHILVTQNGNAIVQGDDKYYYYAFFDEYGGRHSTGVRVGSKDATAEILSNSSNIPYEQIRALAANRRKQMPVEEKNLIQRLNEQRGPMTKADSPIVKHGLVILVNFSDVQFRWERQDFVNMLTQTGYSYNGAVGCAKEYFDAQFGGSYEFGFDVFGPYTVSKKQSYYGGNDSNGDDMYPEEMIVEACKLANEDVDFSLYDDDKDGEIDNVFVFYAGGDEAEGAGDDCIWPHAYYIKDGARKTVYLDGVLLNRYACTSELTTYDRGKTFYMAPIGTFCHEYSHTFGLADLYDTDYESSKGTADALWCYTALMDGGNANSGGNIPPNYNAVDRDQLGFGNCLELPAGAVTLEKINESNTYYKIDSSNKGEYYLLECRENTGWDSGIGNSGLLVYHIDKSSNKAGTSTTYRKTLTASERWSYNEVNANPTHECADLIEANPSAKSAKQVFFPYDSYNKLTTDGKTPVKWWSGEIANINITGITFADGKVTMTVSGDGSTDTPPSVKFGTKDVFQDAAVISFKSSYEYSGEATVQYGVTGKTQETIKVKPYSDGNYAVVLENLTPSTSYSVTVYFEKDGLVGASEKTSIMTASYSSKGLPYIYLKSVKKNDDGSFPANSKLPLRVYNKRGDVDGIVWYLNAIPIKIGSDGYYTIERSANIKAEVLYKDGSKDVIVKKIDLK